MGSRMVIGREREIAEANGFLADVAQRSRGLLLAGEPGMGKTTIWSAVVDEAVERGFGVLVARPSEAEAELAFSVLTDLFAAVENPTLAELPGVQRAALEQALRRGETGSPVDPVAVALAVLGALRLLSASSPLIVAVDDLQWVDAPSLRALTYAFRRLEDAPVGLVASVRVGFDLELTRLAERDGSSLDRIEIGGLGKRQLARIVFERTGRTLSPPQVQSLARLSGGSPYYALEIAATGDLEHVPGVACSRAARAARELVRRRTHDGPDRRDAGARRLRHRRHSWRRAARASRREDRRRADSRQPVVHAPAARVDAAGHAHARGAAARPRLARGRARGSRRARASPRPRNGGSE